MFGGGHYQLRDIKEIQTTESFSNLGQETTGCQRLETRESCEARLFLEDVEAGCDFVPHSLASFSPHQVNSPSAEIRSLSSDLMVSRLVSALSGVCGETEDRVLRVSPVL